MSRNEVHCGEPSSEVYVGVFEEGAYGNAILLVAFFVATLKALTTLNTVSLFRIAAMRTHRFAIPTLLNKILAAIFFSLEGVKEFDQGLEFHIF